MIVMTDLKGQDWTCYGGGPTLCLMNTITEGKSLFYAKEKIVLLLIHCTYE